MFKRIRNERLTVTVNFFGSYGLGLQSNMLTGKDVRGFSKFIRDFVLINIPEYGKRKLFEQYDLQIGEQILPDQIDHILIDHKYGYWSQSEGGLVPDIRSEALYKSIASKDSKLKNYNGEWDEV